MGNTFGPNRFSGGSSTHKANLPDAGYLAGKDRAEIKFFTAKQISRSFG